MASTINLCPLLVAIRIRLTVQSTLLHISPFFKIVFRAMLTTSLKRRAKVDGSSAVARNKIDEGRIVVGIIVDDVP